MACLVILVSPTWAKTVTISQVHLSEDGTTTRFEADLSGAVGFSVNATQSPYRLTIDLLNVSFDLPAGAGRKAAGPVTAFRYGVVDDHRSRIVLDLSGPVLIKKSYIVPRKNKKEAHMVVEMTTTTPDHFKQALNENLPVNQPETAAITSAPILHPLKTIVIDPGHGGIDPGASSPTKTKEKDVVLAYAQELKTALEKTGHYKAVLTRDEDTYLPLEARVKIARDNKADLFIVVHADTMGPLARNAVRGTTVYTVSDEASDAEAGALAQKENRADIITGIDLGHQNKMVTDILINLAQRESKNQAMFFAKKAVGELQNVTMMTGKPIRSAAFVVLKAPDVPSVLVELGYLSSPADEALLTSSDWRSKMAGAMTQAVNSYFAPHLTVAKN